MIIQIDKRFQLQNYLSLNINILFKLFNSTWH